MKLRIKDVLKDDFGKKIARIDQNVFVENKINAGDTICIYNDSTKKVTAAIAFPSDFKDRGTKNIRIDAILRRNLNASLDNIVRIRRIKSYLAQQVSFSGYQQVLTMKNPGILAEKLKNCLVSKGDIFTFRSGKKKVDLIVLNHTPETLIILSFSFCE